jgi:hypothetical protein
MPTLAEQIISLIFKQPGMTDREITNELRGASAPQQPINQTARNLEAMEKLVRQKRPDGKIGNYPAGPEIPIVKPSQTRKTRDQSDSLSEDKLKEHLEKCLVDKGWRTDIAWGNARGADIVATRGRDRWVIEVKGISSRPPMRVNYFLAILGETLQRMDDPRAKYSIALPDVQQFRTLWQRLPHIAKKRTGITALFVSEDGSVTEKIT